MHPFPQNRAGGVTILIVKIIIYALTFAIVLAVAAAIVALSLAVAPPEAKSSRLAVLAIALSGLAVAGGVVYLAEKLTNLGKGVGSMVTQLVVETFKKHQWEAGKKVGIEEGIETGRKEGIETGRKEGIETGRKEGIAEGVQEGQQREREAWQGWHARQEAAFREGRPFDEPPPGAA